ncbi:hypothetical protein MWU78_17110 [Arenibacter sp. F26102]|uniref:hypothetical protein n=1 Tax=Arenibacter sp. F26102 TaxID=2926416 RepID=UPI001FF4590B|nr:hypothetical protein [Arenibacter sp. F26102]MCK0147377.1 hypothetical protein [Arenibacter sp. F26102]
MNRNPKALDVEQKSFQLSYLVAASIVKMLTQAEIDLPTVWPSPKLFSLIKSTYLAFAVSHPPLVIPLNPIN